MRLERGTAAVEGVLLAALAVVATGASLWLGEVVTERAVEGVEQTDVQIEPSVHYWVQWDQSCDKYATFDPVAGVSYGYVVTPATTFVCEPGDTWSTCGSGCLTRHGTDGSVVPMP